MDKAGNRNPSTAKFAFRCSQNEDVALFASGDQAHAVVRMADLHDSLGAPAVESASFLDELSRYFPDAISFATGRPFEGFFAIEDLHRYLRVYSDHLRAKFHGDEARTRRTIMQYGRARGIIHELIARHLQVDEGITADPESIVVTVGCQEGLYLTLRALRRTAEDVVLAVRPCYTGLAGAAELVDMPLLPVADSPEGIDLADLARVVERAKADGLRPRACYVAADFGDPSGACLSRTTREGLLRLADEHDFLVLEDNPAGTFGGRTGRPPALKALDTTGRVIHLGSFSRTGFPGARVGYVVADQRVTGTTGPFADQLAKIKGMLTVNTSPFAQAVIGGKLLENGYSLRAANTREAKVYRENRQQVLEGLAARFPVDTGPRVTWNTPGGGFFAVLTVPFDVGDDLLEQSARQHRVLWTPMHHFYGDGRPRPQLRLSFGNLSPVEIERGLDRLTSFVHERCD